MLWNVVVLAGDRDPRDPVARAGLSPWKARAPVGDLNLIDFPLAALRASMDEGRIGRIIVAQQADAPPPSPGPWDVIEAGATVGESLSRAYDAVGAPLLIVACDAAMLTPDLIGAFLEAAGDGFSIALTPLAIAEETPDAPPRIAMRLKEGAFVKANLFALKSPPGGGLTEVKRLGDMIPASGLRAPSLDALGERAARRFGITSKIVTLDEPEAGFEVNTALDLIHLRRRYAAWLAGSDEAEVQVDRDQDEDQPAEPA